MARFRRPIIHSEKKEATWTALSEDASSEKTIVIYNGTPSADVNLGTEIEVGSVVKWVYFEFHFSAETTTAAKVVHWVIQFVPDGMTTSIPSVYNPGSKSYTIKRGMAMLVRDQATVFKERFVVKIPRSYQRVKVNTQLEFRYVSTSSNTQNACGFTICKPTK